MVDTITETGISPKIYIPEIDRNISSAEEWTESYFERSTRYSFDDFGEQYPENPKLAELCDYARSLEGKFEYLKKDVGLPEWKAKMLMNKIPEEDVDSGFDALILKLQNNTQYLDELEDVGISAALLNGLENGKYGAKTLFLAPDSIFAKFLKKRDTAGAYLPIPDVAIFPEKLPNERDMWLMLATEGKLPRIVSTLDHELTHDAQWSKLQRSMVLGTTFAPSVGYYFILQKYGLPAALAYQVSSNILASKINKRIAGDELIREIHAYEASANSPTSQSEESDLKIVGHIRSAYEIKDKTFSEALTAYNQIHALRALGLDDQELGKLVRNTRFDSKTRTYPKLENRILQEKENWGIEDNSTFEKVVRAVIAKHDLELKVQRHKAEEIAARELELETGKWFD